MAEIPICIYNSKRQARILAPIYTADSMSFLIGTLSPKEQMNEIHWIQYDEDLSEIKSTIWKHEGEIVSMSPSMFDVKLLFTISQSVKSSKLSRVAILWQIPIESEEKDSLTEFFRLLLEEDEHGQLLQVLWDAHNPQRFALIGTKGICFYLSPSEYQRNESPLLQYSLQTADLTRNQRQILNVAKWNPHASEVAIGSGPNIYGIDSRDSQIRVLFKIENAHCVEVNDLDYNVNKPYTLISCGKDCNIRLWDTRSCSCLLQVSNHTHWIWSLQYNPFHDQLIISGSSDFQVNLENVISQSSFKEASSHDPTLDSTQETSREEEEEAIIGKTNDGLVAAFDQHEDSVYSVSWSHADPWVFASLSFDGIVVIRHVPTEFKYKIMGL